MIHNIKKIANVIVVPYKNALFELYVTDDCDVSTIITLNTIVKLCIN